MTTDKTCKTRDDSRCSAQEKRPGGSRARSLFAQNGIQVMVGASGGAPESLVPDFLAGRLVTGANICDH